MPDCRSFTRQYLSRGIEEARSLPHRGTLPSSMTRRQTVSGIKCCHSHTHKGYGCKCLQVMKCMANNVCVCVCVCVCVSLSNAGSILAVLNNPSFEHRQPSWVRRSLRITHRVAPPTIVPATDAAGVRGRRREGDQVDWGFRGTREVDMKTEFAGAPAVRITLPPTPMLPLSVSA